jgi:hypothetical protein
MKRFEAELVKEDWTRVRPEVEVKKVAIPQGEETLPDRLSFNRQCSVDSAIA